MEFLPPTSDVRPYLGASTLFVLPSYYREGLPRTILEALATGRPVITTDMPGCRDAIVDGKNGIVIPPKCSQSLADAIVGLLADRAKLEAMSRCAREIAVNTYDVDIVNAQLLDCMGLTRQQTKDAIRVCEADNRLPESNAITASDMSGAA